MKIGVKHFKHVFIDDENEEDFNTIYSKNFINFWGGGDIMKIQKWTWHFFEWNALCRVIGLVVTSIFIDKSTLSKTKPTTTKLRVEIDLNLRNSFGDTGTFMQKIE